MVTAKATLRSRRTGRGCLSAVWTGLMCSLGCEQLVSVHGETGGEQLASERHLPTITWIHHHVRDSVIVGRKLQCSFVERADARTAQLADEEPEFEHHVLSCPVMVLRRL